MKLLLDENLPHQMRLELPGHEIFTAAYMKGRTNYLCLHRFDRLREVEAALPPADRRWLDRITEWARATETGDRSEVEDMPDDFPLWGDLTANADQCLGRECPSYADCFVTRMKERAAEADIVVVNHHLLCADAAVRDGGFGEVIPECDLAVMSASRREILMPSTLDAFDAITSIAVSMARQWSACPQ